MVQGSGIFLRFPNSEDALTLFRWENDAAIQHYTDTPKRYTLQEIQEFISNCKNVKDNGQLRFMICDKTTSTAIGTIDLYDIAWRQERGGVGVLIANEAFRGKGHATEAVDLFLEFCTVKLGISNYFCSIQESNAKSVKLFERTGFTFVGRRKRWFKSDFNTWEDELMYQKLVT